jgi:alginate O-acetyltransferase complex protein AlgI
LSIISWYFTLPDQNIDWRVNTVTGVVVAAIVLLISLTRYLGGLCCLTATKPPPILQVILFGLLIFVAIAIISRFMKVRHVWIISLSILILIIFVIIKSEPLSILASKILRSINGQSAALASGIDIRWLGFSYIAFRLLHTLNDRLNGRLPSLNLADFIVYIIFYPSFSAGPIDRVQHFVQNIHQPFLPNLEALLQSGKRILIGIFRKFVLADGLAIFALNNLNSSQVNSTGWLWIMTYAYAFRIYFDFSGYTDIAIGLGSLVGIQLPENFDKPYRKQNLTLFWNSWHITLANWFRAYFFNPLTRTMRSKSDKFSLPMVIFIGQLSTFILIGLWHGITWNFAIWGAWHGIGLFIHNRWSDYSRSRGIIGDPISRRGRIIRAASTFLTFHYVTLGWIWFALSSPGKSWWILQKLFGLA